MSAVEVKQDNRLDISVVSPNSLFEAFLPQGRPEPKTSVRDRAKQVELPSLGSFALLPYHERNFPILIIPEPSAERAIGRQIANRADFDVIATAFGDPLKPSRLVLDRSAELSTALIERTIQGGKSNSCRIAASLQRKTVLPQQLVTLAIRFVINGCIIDYIGYRSENSGKTLYSGKMNLNGLEIIHSDEGFRHRGTKATNGFTIRNAESGTPHDVLTGLFSLSCDPGKVNLGSGHLSRLFSELSIPQSLLVKANIS